ncbi:precorrin-3B C(17)-methyltransferase [Halomonas elongata]|uniref:Precorrin-3B C(17)-methyltransferase n=1 Tax=Halomonas elongata (strain ATCC 33173 / DSM 2581 / NBRC 15536 / NCIMB 2198 / 1H9) TaxID=768066 RepID=E1V8U5_HALED|nr:precorrin-3B C(17)-methyltransferase [Halomonas elongata]WBF18961.1 precorrin-3B C(17)-methyltransferase [Halomonas elongata]WPU47821.1 precorrin-3B C(17)-methyltransferase [Halomonas elongata DSM 2581]CBV41720.1 precorrin-3B C17-methyltransferase [Halomonas elongata DSM 2581]
MSEAKAGSRPGERERVPRGWLKIVGLGPGSEAMITPEASGVLEQATDVVGYVPYVERVAPRPGLTRHGSDNREEIRRAEQALEMAAEGRRVAVVSSGDPGVFAMGAAVFEALEAGRPEWRSLDIQVLPGVSAMLAASARLGAPLGHDFCCLNLSDNLKPWTLIEKRLRLAAEADFAMAFYNPRSRSRPEGFARALTVLREACGNARPIMFARAVSTPEERLHVTTLGEATPELADMRTLVMVGSSLTRCIPGERREWVYTPRSAPSSEATR